MVLPSFLYMFPTVRFWNVFLCGCFPWGGIWVAGIFTTSSPVAVLGKNAVDIYRAFSSNDHRRRPFLRDITKGLKMEEVETQFGVCRKTVQRSNADTRVFVEPLLTRYTSESFVTQTLISSFNTSTMLSLCRVDGTTGSRALTTSFCSKNTNGFVV